MGYFIKEDIMFKFKKHNICPLCNKESSLTIKSMIKNEYKKNMTNFEGFHFCSNANCNVIYFQEEKIIKQCELIKKVGLKEWTNPKTICYCFNLTKEKYRKKKNTKIINRNRKTKEKT